MVQFIETLFERRRSFSESDASIGIAWRVRWGVDVYFSKERRQRPSRSSENFGVDLVAGTPSIQVEIDHGHGKASLGTPP